MLILINIEFLWHNLKINQLNKIINEDNFKIIMYLLYS